MKFGVTTLTRGCFTTRAAYEQAAGAAERLGYDFIAVNDHVVVPSGIASNYPYSETGAWEAAESGHCFDQLATLSFLAGCTKRLRLMSSVMVVPHRHPVLAAKMIATADVLSEGRIILGIGAGWMKEEFDVLEAPFEGRGQATDEYIEAMKALWTEALPSYEGKFVAFDDVLFSPKPSQKPHPPIWVGGESKPAMRRAVRLGDGWYPGSVNPARRLDTIERLKASIAEIRGMCETEGRDPATLGLGFTVQTPVAWSPVMADGARRLFTGSAADMAEDTARLAALGISHVGLRLQADTLPATVEAIERFGREVIPLVTRA